MYERYWKLDRAPFDHDRSADMFFSSRLHGESLVKLKYLIEHGKGSAALIGASGAGKTHVLEMVRLAFPQRPVVQIIYPQLSAYELVSLIASSLDGNSNRLTAALPTLDVLLTLLDHQLSELTQSGRSPLIIIDDAHLIEDRKVFQSLHQLMNYQRPGRSNFALVLAGQPDLVNLLQRSDQISDRLAFQCLLQSLTSIEVEQYIRHRLQAAGRMETIFDNSAVQAIYELSSGIPRRINRLCDFALLIGYANQLSLVSADQIEGVHAEITQSNLAA